MSEPSTQDWYVNAFREAYLDVYAHRNDGTAAAELENLLARLDLPPRARVLDLCCGAGRHTLPMLRRGLDATGIDLSPDLLHRARDRSELLGRLVRGDMRALPFSSRFDAVLNLFTSFGYFPDDRQNTLVIHEAARILRPGGLLVLDHMNAPAVCRSLGEDVREGKTGSIRQRRWMEGNRVRKEIRLPRPEGGERVIREDVRVYAPEEMRKMLASAGFEEILLWGAVDGSPLTGDSARMVAVGRRPA